MPSTLLRSSLATALLLASAAPALAQSSKTPTPALQVAGDAPPAARPTKPAQVAGPDVGPPKERRRWYGWQTLAAYAVTDAITITGVALGYSLAKPGAGIAIGTVGGALHVAAGPVVHLLNGGHAGTIWLSALTHLMGPGIGGLISSAVKPTPGCPPAPTSECDAFVVKRSLVGVAFGSLAAGVVDVAVLSYAKIPERRAAQSPHEIAVIPQIGGGTWGLGVGGRF